MKQELDTTENGQKKLKWSEKIAYGFGDFGNGFMFDLGQAYLTKFYTDIALIPAGMVGVIFSITKIFDAFMDPLAGSFVDTRKNHGKQGRFRPVMMFSSIILAILTIITFTMPNFSMTGKIAYAFATYMIWGVVYSFTNIPYGSLASVMTRDIDDRAHLATTRQAGSLGAQLVTGVAFIPIVMLFSEADGTINAHGYTIAAAVMALCGVLGFLVCFLGTREHIQINRSVNAEKEGIKDYIKVVFTNKPLGAIILLTIFTISAMNTNNTMMVYFCQYNLGNIHLQPIVNGIMMGSSVVAILLIPTLVKKFGKKNTAVASFIIGVIANGITWAFVSDVIDYGEWHTGIRKEGITYAAFNFSRKIAQSLAAVVSAAILGLTGYVGNTAPTSETLTGIKGAMTLYPAFALAMAAIIIFFLYGLSDDKYRQIASDLSKGKWEHGELRK